MHARHFLLYLVPVFLVLGIIFSGSFIQERFFSGSQAALPDEVEVMDVEPTENIPEADSDSDVALGGTWVWSERRMQDGTVIEVQNIERFSLTFAQGLFETTTDCNMVGGAYEQSATEIAFTDISMTKMYCEGSSEQVFVDTLSAARSYELQDDERLVLTLEGDEGTAVFSKR